MTHRTPHQIQFDIDRLQKELAESKLANSKTLIHIDKPTSEMIGFFDIGKAKKILSNLNGGSILLLEHEYLGSYKVKLNPQLNRIIVNAINDEKDNLENINENNIMDFIMWKGGIWYKLNNES